MKKILIMFVLLFLLTVFVNAQESDHKFIREFMIWHGEPKVTREHVKYLAERFDLVLFSRYKYSEVRPLGTWKAIKAENPDVEIYIYQAGHEVSSAADGKRIIRLNNLGRWNISRGHSMGNLNTDNPDLFLLTPKGNRLEHKDKHYRGYWFMDMGSSKYQDYWLEATINDLVDRPWTADGVFVDNVLPSLAHMKPGEVPVKYPTDERWSAAMIDFVRAITAGLHRKGQKIWGNAGFMTTENEYKYYVALDNLPDPPDAIMNEGALAIGWGRGDVMFLTEEQWRKQIDLMSDIHNYKLVYESHTELRGGESGFDNRGRKVNFFDILWFAMASYHIGKNEVDGNSYFSFRGNPKLWENEVEYINLGKAVGKYRVKNFRGNNIYWREFEKGYVFVNPTPNDVSSIPLPMKSKRLTRYNLKNDPKTIPDVNKISLKSHRGTMLLKSDYQPQKATYYVDATNGNDSHAGTSPSSA